MFSFCRNQLTFDYGRNKTRCLPSNAFIKGKLLEIKSTISFLLMAVIPLCVVIPTNITIILKVVLQRKQRLQLGAGSSRDETTKVTLMTLSVTISYIILLLPMSIYIFISNADQSNYHIIIALANLPYLNMSINFYLYFLSGKRFREETIKLLRKIFCNCKETQLSESRRAST